MSKVNHWWILARGKWLKNYFACYSLVWSLQILRMLLKTTGSDRKLDLFFDAPQRYKRIDVMIKYLITFINP